MWKRRFSILHSKIRMKLENVFHLIVACGVWSSLANIAVKKGLPDLDDDDYEEESSDDEEENKKRFR
jgi:hypothetical protein